MQYAKIIGDIADCRAAGDEQGIDVGVEGFNAVIRFHAQATGTLDRAGSDPDHRYSVGTRFTQLACGFSEYIGRSDEVEHLDAWGCKKSDFHRVARLGCEFG
ncbi:hypothetical protein PFUM301597_03410 [Pseudomonas fluorescens]